MLRPCSLPLCTRAYIVFFMFLLFDKFDLACLMLQVKTEGGKIIRVEAHPIPEHPRPRRVKGRAALVGDAAGYVTKCSGEGIYFAAKSGRMAAEAIAEASQQVGSEAGCQFALALLQSLPVTLCVTDVLATCQSCTQPV